MAADGAPRGGVTRGRRLLPLLAGAALPLAFAPVGLFPLAVVAPALLFWLWQAATPRQAFVSGYLFGLGYFGVGVSWVSISMYRFGGMGMFTSGLATSLFVLFLALFPALLGWSSRRYASRLPVPLFLLLWLPAGWVMLEWVRGWIFTGFPWLSLGYSQTDSPLAGLAPVLGVYGISLAVLISAGLLVLALRLWPGGGTVRWRPWGGLLALWLGSGLLLLPQWSQPHGRPLTASLIQGNVPQEMKWRPEQRAPTIELYTRLSRERWDRDIVIWPETALPAYYHQAESFLRNLAREAREQGGASLLVGLPAMDETASQGYFNAVVRVGESPQDPSQFYFKSHLVPFGEYIPLKSMLGDLLKLLQVPMANFSRGAQDQPLITAAGHAVGVSICYEDAFGEEVIRALPEAALLVNVSNDAWFGDSLAPHQHLQMARMRSMETARPMLRATNNGVSAIIDARGRVLATSPQFQVAVLDGEVQPRSGATPYVRTGNAPVLLLSALALALCGWRARRG